MFGGGGIVLFMTPLFVRIWVCFSFGISCLGVQSSKNLLFVTSKIVPSTIFTNLAPVIIEVTQGSTRSLRPGSLISP